MAMLIATILFIVVAALYSSKYISIGLIKFIGVVFVSGYFYYILMVSNLI